MGITRRLQNQHKRLISVFPVIGNRTLAITRFTSSQSFQIRPGI